LIYEIRTIGRTSVNQKHVGKLKFFLWFGISVFGGIIIYYIVFYIILWFVSISIGTAYSRSDGGMRYECSPPCRAGRGQPLIGRLTTRFPFGYT